MRKLLRVRHRCKPSDPKTLPGDSVSSANEVASQGKKTCRLFYSYCHKDEVLRKELEIRLKPMQRKGVITSWHDRLIEAGQEWRTQISRNLEQADIILLLVSADFIASDYSVVSTKNCTIAARGIPPPSLRRPRLATERFLATAPAAGAPLDAR